VNSPFDHSFTLDRSFDSRFVVAAKDVADDLKAQEHKADVDRAEYLRAEAHHTRLNIRAQHALHAAAVAAEDANEYEGAARDLHAKIEQVRDALVHKRHAIKSALLKQKKALANKQLAKEQVHNLQLK